MSHNVDLVAIYYVQLGFSLLNGFLLYALGMILDKFITNAKAWSFKLSCALRGFRLDEQLDRKDLRAEWVFVIRAGITIHDRQ
jgi:hypothetical protein